MSANIKTYIGRQAAWHSLGTVTGKFNTWSEILAAGGLDFDVVKSPLYSGLGKQVKAWGTFRWNHADKLARNSNAEFLGVVGEDYKVINHAQGFEMVDALMGVVDGSHYESAGVLGAGEVVWGLADLGLRVHVGADESIPYLLFATSHDGSYSYQFRTCVERVVCQNTLNIALGEKARASFKIRHTKNAQARISDANLALAAFQNDTAQVETKLNFLAGRKMIKESFQRIMDRLFPKREAEIDGPVVNQTRRDNVLAEICQMYENNDNNTFPEQRGTAYNLLNAITGYVDHERSSKGDMRAQSALFGSGDKLKTSALAAILDEAHGLPMARVAQSSETVDWSELGMNIAREVSR